MLPSQFAQLAVVIGRQGENLNESGWKTSRSRFYAGWRCAYPAYAQREPGEARTGR
jgi:hypothetical protein